MPDKYTLRPTDLGSPKDDFEFRFNGCDVGRTYAKSTPQGPRWHWSIYGLNLRGPFPQGVQLQGLADDLEAAKGAFKANWEKLLTAEGEALSAMAKKTVKPAGWNRPLAYSLTLRDGSIIDTMAQAAHFMTQLPEARQQKPIWQHAAALLMEAHASGKPDDLQHATGQLHRALHAEGWAAERR